MSFLHRSRVFCLATTVVLLPAAASEAQRPGPPGTAYTAGVKPAVIRDVVIHPLVDEDYTCSEHSLDFAHADVVILGDAIGTDCTVVRYDRQQTGRRPPQYYRNDGAKNEDWYGWNEPLLAPFDGVVEEVHVNPVTNVPGTPGRGPSSYIVFRRADSTRVTYGHVQDVKVAAGDTVRAGQPVAVVGNNGFGYMPHTHIGAWRGTEPLQIRFDLLAKGRLATERFQRERQSKK